MGGLLRVCLGALLVAAICISPVGGDSHPRLTVEVTDNVDLLPLGITSVITSDGGTGSKSVRDKYRTVQVGRGDSLHAQYIVGYNPGANADLPAIISFQDFTTHSVIDDTPLWFTLTGYDLVPRPDSGLVVIATGYRNDSAFAVSIVPGTDSVSWLYLTSGDDRTGNGQWEADVASCGTFDYDYDGHTEIFLYVNAMRDLKPRTLFCLDPITLSIEWSLPVASIVGDGTLYPTGDSADPGVIFTSYNPKQGVSDTAFSDTWGYLTVVDRHGVIRYNRVIAAEHGGMKLEPADRPGEFYLGHTIPPTPPADTLTFPERRHYLSKITADGTILAQIESPTFVVSLWPATDLGERGTDFFVLDGDRRITRFDSNLRVLAQSDKTFLGAYRGWLDLGAGDGRTLVFTAGGASVFFDSTFHQIGYSPVSGSIVSPLYYDRAGRLSDVLFSGGNRGDVVLLTRRGFWDMFRALVVRYHLYLLGLVIVLLIALVAINQRRLYVAERLRRSRADYHAFVTTSPDLVFRMRRDGIILGYEARSREMLATSPENFMNQPVERVLPPELARACRDQIERTLSTGIMQTLDYELQLKGDTPQVFESRMAPVSKNEIIAVVRDITARTRTEEALRRSEERFRTLVSNIPGAIYRSACDDSRTIDFISDEIENICGFKAADFVGSAVRTFTDVIHPDDRAAVRRAVDDSIADRRPYLIEYRLVDRDGNIHWVYDKGQAMYADDTAGDAPVPLWLDGALFDISEQKTAEDALRESEEKLRAQYKGIPVPTYTWQRSGDDFVLIDYNDAALEITAGGITRFVGSTAGVMYHDFAVIREDLDRCFRERTTINREMVYEFVTTRRSTDLSIRYVYVPPNLVMVHTEDITERKRARAQLDQRLRYEESLAACSAALLASPASDGTVDSALETLLVATGLCRVYLFKNFTDAELGLCSRMTHEVCRPGVEPQLGRALYRRFAYDPQRVGIRDRLASGDFVTVIARDQSGDARRILESQNVRSCLLLPVFVSGRWTGFVGFDDCRNDREWDAQDIRLLRTAAEMFGSYFAIVDTQRRLVEERDFNRSILLTANSLIVCLDEDGSVTVFNDELERVTGYKRAEVIGKRWSELFIPPRYHGELSDGIRAWLEEAPSGRYEREMLTRSGEERTVTWSYSAMTNPHTGALTVIAIGHDITERRRAEAATREAAEKYRAVMEQSSDNIYLVDVASKRVIEANVALQRLLGYSAEEMENLSIYDFIDHRPEDIDEKVDRVLDSNLTFLPERYYRCRDGRRVPVEVVANSFEYYGRTVLCIVSRDISKRQEAERALREQEEKYRLLVENVRASIALVDCDGRFLFINEVGARTQGKAIDDIVGKSMWELFPPVAADIQMNNIRNVIINRTEFSEEAYTFMNNTWRWFYINIQPYVDATGQVTAALVIAHDISDSKQAELALHESEQRFRELADLLPQTLFEVDSHGFITYTNRHGYEATGYVPADLEGGLHLERLFRDDERDEAVQNFRGRLQGLPPGRVEYNLLRKDGSSYPVLIYSAPIVRDGETTGLRGVVVDITEQKDAEERIRRANQVSYQQMKEMAGGVSHEIYNSLYPAAVAIEKTRQLLDQIVTVAPERIEKLIALTEKAVRRAIAMTENVTRYSRLEAEKQEEVVRLRAVFDEILESNQHRIEALGVSVVETLDDGLEIVLSRTHAYSMLNNLVVNALDALAESERRELRLIGTSDNGWVRLEIADSGPGIPADVRDRIFAPFYSTKPNRGAGLGLAMARRMVELYGGTITVESSLDRLTSFVILLPQARDS